MCTDYRVIIIVCIFKTRATLNAEKPVGHLDQYMAHSKYKLEVNALPPSMAYNEARYQMLILY